MSAETEGLKQAVTDLATAASNNASAVSEELNTLNAKVAGANGLSDAEKSDITASTAAIETIVGNLNTATAAAQAAVAPAA